MHTRCQSQRSEAECCLIDAPATQDNVAVFCALAHEFDIGLMMESAEDWLVDAASRGAVLVTPFQQTQSLFDRVSPVAFVNAAREFLKILNLAREYKLRRFAAASDARVNMLTAHEAHLLLRTETAEALK